MVTLMQRTTVYGQVDGNKKPLHGHGNSFCRFQTLSSFKDEFLKRHCAYTANTWFRHLTLPHVLKKSTGPHDVHAVWSARHGVKFIREDMQISGAEGYLILSENITDDGARTLPRTNTFGFRRVRRPRWRQ